MNSEPTTNPESPVNPLGTVDRALRLNIDVEWFSNEKHIILSDTDVFFLKVSCPLHIQEMYDKYISVDVSMAQHIYLATMGQKNVLWMGQRQV